MDMNKIIGLEVFGAIIIFLMVLVFLKIFGKTNAGEYDERQKIVRGDAYKYGFWAVCLTNIILMAICVHVDISKILGINLFCIPLFVGILTHISYAIFNDGYIKMNANIKRYITLIAVFGVIDIISAITCFTDGEMIVDGVLQTGFLNLLSGVLFLIIVVELIVKKVIDKREE